MKAFLTRTLATTVAILLAALLLNGVTVKDSFTAIVVAVVLGFLNAFVRPILIILTIPITILTLGLFVFIINIILIMWVAKLVPGFAVSNWWSALWFSIIVSILSTFIQGLITQSEDN